jgi:uncharacterized protein YecE (DUF72 family)
VERLCKELNIIPCLDLFDGPLIRASLLYVRLHGKTGYRYHYSEEDLIELQEKARPYSQSYLMFNNLSMYEDAHRLKKLLEEDNPSMKNRKPIGSIKEGRIWKGR